MNRRTFLKTGSLNAVALSMMKWTSWNKPESVQAVSPLWIHGSPYLGHSDLRPHFRGLTPRQIQHELNHFHTTEAWRRVKLFKL